MSEWGYISFAELKSISIDGLEIDCVSGWTPIRAMNLMKRGIDENRAWMSAANQRGSWWTSGAYHINEAFPKRFFDSIGLVSLLGQLHRIQCGS